MAERGFTPITVHPLFKDKSLSAGESGTSAAVDLRYTAQRGSFALHVSAAAGTAGTCGTTVLSYQLATSLDGTYIAPSAAAPVGTSGTAAPNDVFTFQPALMPFIKIVATQSGTSGNDSKITAELIVQ